MLKQKLGFFFVSFITFSLLFYAQMQNYIHKET